MSYVNTEDSIIQSVEGTTMHIDPVTQSCSMGSPRPYRILALDGGGIRGLITAVWLHRLEQELGAPIHKHFDLIAGTSTGSILACAIALGKPTGQLIDLYKLRGREIFPSSWLSRILKWIRYLIVQGIDQPIYSDSGLRKVLQDEFDGRRFGELSKPTLVVSYDTLNRKAICFHSLQERYHDIPIWEICKASSSAPAYFPAHLMTIKQGETTYTIPLIDGGVVTSNPTACAIAEGIKDVRRQGRDQNIKDIVVVSLGTGDASHPIHIQQAKRWGVLKWMFNITEVMFDGVSQAMDHVASNLLCPDNYFRLQARLNEDSLDDVSEANLNALHAFANAYFNTVECKATITKLKQKLIDCQNDLGTMHKPTNLTDHSSKAVEMNSKAA